MCFSHTFSISMENHRQSARCPSLKYCQPGARTFTSYLHCTVLRNVASIMNFKYRSCTVVYESCDFNVGVVGGSPHPMPLLGNRARTGGIHM